MTLSFSGSDTTLRPLACTTQRRVHACRMGEETTLRGGAGPT
jgi:hypothetical protein